VNFWYAYMDATFTPDPGTLPTYPISGRPTPRTRGSHSRRSWITGSCSTSSSRMSMRVSRRTVAGSWNSGSLEASRSPCRRRDLAVPHGPGCSILGGCGSLRVAGQCGLMPATASSLVGMSVTVASCPSR
jgi:hypothetical protein